MLSKSKKSSTSDYVAFCNEVGFKEEGWVSMEQVNYVNIIIIWIPLTFVWSGCAGEGKIYQYGGHLFHFSIKEKGSFKRKFYSLGNSEIFLYRKDLNIFYGVIVNIL